MGNSETENRAALRALDWARSIRAAIEQRDRAHRAAPSNSPADVLDRLRANERLRAFMRGRK